MKIIIFSLFIVFFSGCIHSKVKFQKKKLLSPVMDSSETTSLSDSMMSEASLWHENYSPGSNAATQGNCPTCGG